jgi:quercetin dioxygenase-like cupin family protein
MKRMDDASSPLARPTALASLVDYQPEAVVSRALLKSPGGSLTVFVFAEGEGLSEHTTPHEAVVLILDGEAQISIGGMRAEVRTGEALRLPAHVPHAVHAKTRFKMLLSMIRSPVS